MEKNGIGNRLIARINVEPPRDDQVQNRCSDFVQAIRKTNTHTDVTDRGWLFRDKRENSLAHLNVGHEPSVAAQQTQIAQQRTAPEFSLREDVKATTVLFGEASCDGEFSLNVGLGNLVEWFDFNQTSDISGHAHEKIRHDVSASPRSARPHRVLLIQQLNLQARLCLAPGIPDLQRLLMNRCHERAIRQYHCRRSFELPLAANRATAFWERNQNKRAGCPAAKPKCRDGIALGFNRLR